MADKKLFALCVGINEYPTGVSNLAGCIADAENWKNFLETHYQKTLSPEVLLLTNGQATRKGFIDAFRNHLIQARDGDTVFLHYSGHGSREKSPSAYLKFFPDGMNETLVLSDSRATNEDGNYTGHDLADKELGKLLEEVIIDKPNLNLIVSLDCCHAGSGTRDVSGLANPRLTGDRTDDARSFETYLPGIFTGAEVVPPSSKHILLAACSKYQKAWETKEHTGLFTTSALEILDKYGTQTTFADLYTRTRTLMRKTTNIQDPQLEVHEKYNANQVIFTGGTLEGAGQYTRRIYQVDNVWKLDFGAIHGMPNDKTIELAVYESADDLNQQKSLGNAKSVDVTGHKTTLELDFEADANQEYIGEFLAPPTPPLNVFIYGAQEGQEFLQKTFEKHPSLNFTLTTVDDQNGYTFDAKYIEQDNPHPYFGEVKIIDKQGQLITPKAGDYNLVACFDGYFLLDENNRLIKGCKSGYDDDQAIIILFQLLDKIANWENLTVLQNKAPKLNPDDVEFNLYAGEHQEQIAGTEFTTSLVEVDDPDVPWPSIPFELRFKNNTKQGLHISLIYLDDHYTVIPLYNDYIESKTGETTLISDGLQILSNNRDESGRAYDEVLDEYRFNQSTMIFKLLVSTERLDDFTLEQAGFDIGHISYNRILASRVKGGITKPVKNDWFTKTIRTYTIRQRSKLSKNDLALGETKQLTIKGQEQVVANVKLSSSNSGSRSADKTSLMMSLLEQQDGNLINFDGAVGGTNILEINDVQGDEKLAETPLELTLKEAVSDDELLLPLTFDGEHIFSIGKTQSLENGHTNIAIDEIPVVEEGSRSLGKSLKLAFFKIALKRHPEKIYQLAWVEYLNSQYKKGIIQRHRDNDEIAKKVANAKKVLLLLHGIIGDTEDMAIAVKEIAAEKGYDLVLSFDYENLNSSIEKDISWSLKNQLEQVGFKADDGKELHILAQGMGCLVARWMVERRGGNQLVDRMILVGPPSGGSVLGTLEAYRKLATTALSIAVNVLLPFAGWAGGLLKNIKTALKQGQKLTTTLAEMHENSTFIRDLNDSDDPGVPYAIVAGDVRTYEPSDGSSFSKFREKLSTKLGTFVNGGDANDMIVDYASMKQAGKNSQVEITKVVCHHLNYFQEEVSLEAIKNLL